ncbi:MAG: arylamine N-acetyltransferase [Calditrichaeota bacterium]|nr:MAG: arylamine N-acetyltransferase [Calditrichota bacterium]
MNLLYPALSRENMDQYLHLLGVRKKKPSLEALSELTRAHLWNVPFENLSKAYYRTHRDVRKIPSLEQFIEGVERFQLGGTCYTNNYYFCQLLANIGYKVKLCGADMANPDAHIVSLVTIREKEYLVDVGYAAPFWNPIPLDSDKDYTIQFGQNRYVLKPKDKTDRSRMEFYRDGGLNHWYVINPLPRQIHEFEHIIIESYRHDATFMNALLLTKFSPSQSYIVHNMTTIFCTASKSNIKRLGGKDELAGVIQEWFGIPKEFVVTGINQLTEFRDAWD